MDLSTKSLTFARNLAKPAVSFCKQTFKPNLHLVVQLVIKFYTKKDLAGLEVSTYWPLDISPYIQVTRHYWFYIREFLISYCESGNLVRNDTSVKNQYVVVT